MLPPQPGKKGVAFVAFETFVEAELAVSQSNGFAMDGDDVLTVKLENRTAEQAKAAGGATGQRFQNQPLTTGPAQYAQYTHVPQLGIDATGQKAMRRSAPVAPTRFQPYQAPVIKPRAQNPAATPLPNGTDGNYCIFVYGVQSAEIIEQLFTPFGTVANVKIQPGKKFGFVSMPNYTEAVNGINNLNGMTLRSGVTLQVRMASAEAKSQQ